ncbi:hypothetical protein GGQ92_001053 [Gracilibacillus halotolerans]|uniref:Uncharacterized protein n=1 Tax=Gracilibacillus halotolerans TaxID=74386 RepID=A0A841RJX0_9BACI|nr:hypothetical protein [Gracilibacillus halotolerans]MBB6512272.1 hypothetical protein [Gracilibacillus halotolerans]
MKEQEVYRSILQKMIDATEKEQINSSADFIKKLSAELKQSNLVSVKTK